MLKSMQVLTRSDEGFSNLNILTHHMAYFGSDDIYAVLHCRTYGVDWFSPELRMLLAQIKIHSTR
jgi:hypothetical protein